MPHADITVNPVTREQRIFIQTVWTEKDQVKQIPGVLWDNTRKFWTLPLSWAACVQLRGVFGDRLTLGDDLRSWGFLERVRVKRSLDLREVFQPANHDPATKLYAFQQAGVDFLESAGSALLGDEMGTGKTIQALRALNPWDLPALAIVPNAVKLNWQDEAVYWAQQAVPYVVTGSAAVRKKIIAAASSDPHALVIINYEGLRAHSKLAPYGSTTLKRCPSCGGKNPEVTATKCEVHPRELNSIPFKTVFIDEAHRIKDPHSKQTRATWALAHGREVKRVIPMTGTPIANNAADLWSIMHATAPLEYPRRSAFVDRYCLVSWGAYGGMEVVGLKPETRAEFHKILDPRFRRMPKALVLAQLPPKIRQRRVVELSPKQLKAYKEIESQMVTRLPDGSLMVAKDDLSSQTRLLQFASATMEQTAEGFRMCDPSSKIDQLLEDLDDLGKAQVAVSAEHRQLIELAARRLDKYKISYGLITGAQKPFERDAALREFQAGKLRVMLFTLKAGGTGLTMTAAGTQIRLQRSWSLIDNLQGEDRSHRIGSEQHESINYIDYVAANTVEERQVAKLWAKSERLEEITRDRERLRAAGVNFSELDAEEVKIMKSYLGE